MTIDRGNLRNRHHQVIQKRIMVDLGLLKSGKGAAEHDRLGKPDKTSWDKLQKVAPHREDPLLDGNAHSARYQEMIHDGSGKPETVDHQEEANSENFVMGSDAAGFVNKVKDQVRNRQKKCRTLQSQLLIGCSIASMWIRRFKSNTLTPRTNSQTY